MNQTALRGGFVLGILKMTKPIVIEIDVLYLKAAALVADKKGYREQLKGVYFNFKNGCLQSTNGHIAFTSSPNLFPTSSECLGFIMPNELVEQILKIKPLVSKDDRFRCVEISYFEGLIVAKLAGLTVSSYAVNLKYPDISVVYYPKKNGFYQDGKFTRTYFADYINIATKIAKCFKPLLAKKEDECIQFQFKESSVILNIDNNLAHLIVMGMIENKPFEYFNLEGDLKEAGNEK